MTNPTTINDDRRDIILSTLFYAEKMTGGIITGGASLDELVTWQHLADLKDGIPHQPITNDELRELESRNLVHEDHGVWRGILGRLSDPPVPFGLATIDNSPPP